MKRLLTLRNLAIVIVLGAALGFAVFWIVTIPATVSASALPPYTPNLDNGKTMFNIGGCASCHAVPDKDPQKVDRTRLGGGLALASPFGTFYAPNISPDRQGRHRRLERGGLRHRDVGRNGAGRLASVSGVSLRLPIGTCSSTTCAICLLI